MSDSLCAGSLGMDSMFEVFSGPEGAGRLAVKRVVVIDGHVDATVEGAECAMSNLKLASLHYLSGFKFIPRFYHDKFW